MEFLWEGVLFFFGTTFNLDFSQPLGQRSKVGVFNPFVMITSMLNIRKYVKRLLCGTQEQPRLLPSAFMDSVIAGLSFSLMTDASWGLMVGPWGNSLDTAVGHTDKFRNIETS